MSDPVRPHRVQQKRMKGWRMPPNAVSVARPSRFGNPFAVGSTVTVYGEREVCAAVPVTPVLAVAFYEAWLDEMLAFAYDDTADLAPDDQAYWLAWRKAFEALRGRNLACYCADGEPCHADVLLERANR